MPRELADAIAADGGKVLGMYRDPLGRPLGGGRRAADRQGRADSVPARSQRGAREEAGRRDGAVGRFLDPLIAVRSDGRYWTPNGNHRLGAMTLMGMKAITALVLPEEEVAFQILALNTEKAHNLKERSLEVIRMYRGLVGARGGDDRDRLRGDLRGAAAS